MIVLKFGGSSVASATAMSRVLDIVEQAAQSDRVVLVSSAISGCTDALIAIGRAEDPEHQIADLLERHISIINRLFTGEERTEAAGDCRETFSEIRCIPPVIESFGELLSTRILARKLACEGYKTKWLDSRDLISTAVGSGSVGGPVDTKKSYKAIRDAINASPETRIFVAPGFIARDAEGHVTTLGRGGSDYSAALFAAALAPATLQIWTDVPGIMTTNPKIVPSARTIPSISYKAAFDMARYGAKVLYAPAVAPAQEKGLPINIRNTFDPANPGTVISSRSSGVCEWKGVSALDEPIGGTTTVCLTGEGPISVKGTVRRLNTALREAGIKALDAVLEEDKHNFFFTVRTNVSRGAVAAVHREFFEERALSVIDVYVAGAGAVGTALREIIDACSGRFPAAGKQIRLVEVSSDHSFADRVLATARSRSVFVDCTDSTDIWRKFIPLLQAGINIVSSNRRSLAIPYVDYAAIKAAAAENGCFFRYDTTVGNALPILQSVSDGANCGQGVTLIEAVVSCTLNYIITSYDGTRSESFATLLRRAQDEGLTEQDPRTDLGGRDALRKLLILAREAGVPLEEKDVEIIPMLGPEFFEGGVEDFYRKLEAREPEFIRREDELDAIGKRQRFVATLQREPSGAYRADIRMRLVGIDSPFYWISGTENVTVIQSGQSYPLVIKGSGEGASLAASGIIRNILQ
ncbi:MAG: aspartate kinase [Bacteroidales bacterium]|nr:aspartate kinase [Bacteroidales bacterium]MBR0291325.1 aspartate kinase [Bacteroidales bacterium]